MYRVECTSRLVRSLQVTKLLLLIYGCMSRLDRTQMLQRYHTDTSDQQAARKPTRPVVLRPSAVGWANSGQGTHPGSCAVRRERHSHAVVFVIVAVLWYGVVNGKES